MKMRSRVDMRWGDLTRTAVQRLRAAWWRLRGAEMGSKNSVGRGCLIERPWGLKTGPRAQFEHGVHVKIAVPAHRLRERS